MKAGVELMSVQNDTHRGDPAKCSHLRIHPAGAQCGPYCLFLPDCWRVARQLRDGSSRSESGVRLSHSRGRGLYDSIALFLTTPEDPP